MARIKYNKERLSGKQIGGGGPRDRQMALKLQQQSEMLKQVSPTISAQVSEQREVDLSQYLLLSEVKKKLEEAVAATAEGERKRFESGLKNLNEQLNAERKKVGAVQDQLISANAEIARLKAQINQFPEISEKARQLINEKELSIFKLQAQLDAKEEIYLHSSKDLEELKAKLDKLYDRIADGSIKPLVGSKMDRPTLEDKIFIDPIEKDKEPDLDSHIEIKEDATSKTDSGRDINTDLAKLRNLLKL